MRSDQPEPDDSPGGARGDARGAAEARAGQEPLHGPLRGADQPRERAARAAEHARYRQVVDAANQAATDRAAWAEAVPGLRAAWDEHKQRYPERARDGCR